MNKVNKDLDLTFLNLVNDWNRQKRIDDIMYRVKKRKLKQEIIWVVYNIMFYTLLMIIAVELLLIRSYS